MMKLTKRQIEIIRLAAERFVEEAAGPNIEGFGDAFAFRGMAVNGVLLKNEFGGPALYTDDRLEKVFSRASGHVPVKVYLIVEEVDE